MVGEEEEEEERVSIDVFLKNPPRWFVAQAEAYVRQGRQERLLKALVTAAATAVYGSAHRWKDADRAVREWAARFGGEE